MRRGAAAIDDNGKAERAMAEGARAVALVLALAVSACDRHPAVPVLDLEGMEPQVAQRLRAARSALLEEPGSPDAWGRFGMVSHAHELWAPAETAYREAERLDPSDVRWPYYLGDVLSVVGADPVAAVAELRRAVQLRPNYAPAQMRLGKALVAAGEERAAAARLERALELEPDLQPARLALAQIRLAEDDLEQAVALLERLLAQQPRHAQGLSTLARAYMRQGRRDDARRAAERARDAAVYNLYSDPLMSQVVAEGVSSVLIWERAKAFLDNGDYEQAARGLERVVQLKPDNADAHQQLATAYGNLGHIDGARRHLERTVALRPDRAAARIQLATVLIESDDPAEAIEQLSRVLELAPDDPDAEWLLGRARVEAGDAAGAVRTFETAAARQRATPAWAHDEWGRALAQTGRAGEALTHFRRALELDPKDAQAWFYTGLVHEGSGRVGAAAESYCHSLAAASNRPAQERLNVLGRTCG